MTILSTSESTFDYVIVGTGHYSVPNVPELDGIETFKGRILHSHGLRRFEEFLDKRVLLVSNGAQIQGHFTHLTNLKHMRAKNNSVVLLHTPPQHYFPCSQLFYVFFAKGLSVQFYNKMVIK